MSILINGVSLPPDDKMDLVLCIRHDGTVFSPWGTELGKAIELPPHGDLVDRDLLLKSDDIETLYDALRYAPPIIPADPKKEDI